MSWRDERIGLQIERALEDIRLTPGCDVEILVHDGEAILTAKLGCKSEFEAIVSALEAVPGVRRLRTEVTILEPSHLTDEPRKAQRGVDGPPGPEDLN